MPAGSKPKPAALKRLEGNPGKRRLPDNPAYAPVLDQEPPHWLPQAAKVEWRRLAP